MLLDATAFRTPDAGRTTLSEFVYCKKFAAVKKNSKLLSFGFPNTSINSSSELISVIEETGPFSNGPAIAPMDVATAGTTFVKSISLTETPGETKKLIVYAPLLELFGIIYKNVVFQIRFYKHYNI